MVTTMPAAQATRERLHERIAQLDSTLVDLRAIVSEADARIATASGEVVRATGGRVSFGPRLRQVTISRGDAPPWRYDGGQSDASAAAEAVLAAIEAEAAPPRAALASVERERAEVLAALEQHEAAVRREVDDRAQADAEREARVRVLGELPDWIDRAAGLLARLRQRIG